MKLLKMKIDKQLKDYFSHRDFKIIDRKKEYHDDVCFMRYLNLDGFNQIYGYVEDEPFGLSLNSQEAYRFCHMIYFGEKEDFHKYAKINKERGITSSVIIETDKTPSGIETEYVISGDPSKATAFYNIFDYEAFKKNHLCKTNSKYLLYEIKQQLETRKNHFYSIEEISAVLDILLEIANSEYSEKSLYGISHLLNSFANLDPVTEITSKGQKLTFENENIQVVYDEWINLSQTQKLPLCQDLTEILKCYDNENYKTQGKPALGFNITEKISSVKIIISDKYPEFDFIASMYIFAIIQFASDNNFQDADYERYYVGKYSKCKESIKCYNEPAGIVSTSIHTSFGTEKEAKEYLETLPDKEQYTVWKHPEYYKNLSYVPVKTEIYNCLETLHIIGCLHYFLNMRYNKGIIYNLCCDDFEIMKYKIEKAEAWVNEIENYLEVFEIFVYAKILDAEQYEKIFTVSVSPSYRDRFIKWSRKDFKKVNKALEKEKRKKEKMSSKGASLCFTISELLLIPYDKAELLFKYNKLIFFYKGKIVILNKFK